MLTHTLPPPGQLEDPPPPHHTPCCSCHITHSHRNQNGYLSCLKEDGTFLQSCECKGDCPSHCCALSECVRSKLTARNERRRGELEAREVEPWQLQRRRRGGKSPKRPLTSNQPPPLPPPTSLSHVVHQVVGHTHSNSFEPLAGEIDDGEIPSTLSPPAHVDNNVTAIPATPTTAHSTAIHTRRPPSTRTKYKPDRIEHLQEGQAAEQQRGQGKKKKNTPKIISSRTSSSPTRRRLFPLTSY